MRLISKKEDRKRGKGLLLMGIVVISLIGFVIAQQNQSSEDELSQLEQEISDAGYSWLVNYSVDYPTIEVYEFNQSRLIATFPSINKGLYKIFLTNLSENYSQDVFDLRVVNSDGKKIDYEIYLKKKRIDKIKMMLDEKGGSI